MPGPAGPLGARQRELESLFGQVENNLNSLTGQRAATASHSADQALDLTPDPALSPTSGVRHSAGDSTAEWDEQASERWRRQRSQQQQQHQQDLQGEEGEKVMYRLPDGTEMDEETFLQFSQGLQPTVRTFQPPPRGGGLGAEPSFDTTLSPSSSASDTHQAPTSARRPPAHPGGGTHPPFPNHRTPDRKQGGTQPQPADPLRPGHHPAKGMPSPAHTRPSRPGSSHAGDFPGPARVKMENDYRHAPTGKSNDSGSKRETKEMTKEWVEAACVYAEMGTKKYEDPLASGGDSDDLSDSRSSKSCSDDEGGPSPTDRHHWSQRLSRSPAEQEHPRAGPHQPHGGRGGYPAPQLPPQPGHPRLHPHSTHGGRDPRPAPCPSHTGRAPRTSTGLTSPERDFHAHAPATTAPRPFQQTAKRRTSASPAPGQGPSRFGYRDPPNSARGSGGVGGVAEVGNSRRSASIGASTSQRREGGVIRAARPPPKGGRAALGVPTRTSSAPRKEGGGPPSVAAPTAASKKRNAELAAERGEKEGGSAGGSSPKRNVLPSSYNPGEELYNRGMKQHVIRDTLFQQGQQMLKSREEREVEECTFKPEINKDGHQDELPQKEVFNRLNNPKRIKSKEKENEKRLQKMLEVECPFKPNICKKEEERVVAGAFQERLLRDAERRREEQKQKELEKAVAERAPPKKVSKQQYEETMKRLASEAEEMRKKKGAALKEREEEERRNRGKVVGSRAKLTDKEAAAARLYKNETGKRVFENLEQQQTEDFEKNCSFRPAITKAAKKLNGPPVASRLYEDAGRRKREQIEKEHEAALEAKRLASGVRDDW